ncbi:unnamed protein product [Bemisia tabaci]|uniref:Proteasome assembly chaperone 4 n=1 Tax=Bemisia tabaci TaxID=7038 RepID=A0A9P0F0T9_BEMTA|nr:unnamed protein product [Bemisia tabaci]
MTQSDDGTTDGASIEYCEPSFVVKKFPIQISGADFTFQVLKSEGSLLIWVGAEGEGKLVDLSLGIPTNYDQMPAVTSVFGDFTGHGSSNLAKRLSRLLKKPVYMSCNVAFDRLILPALEKNLIELIKSNPDCF